MKVGDVELAYEDRGHGDSSSPGQGYGFDQLAADLHGLFDAAGIAQADLLGHSLGGMVALRFVLAHPERVASLILMDSGARGVPSLGTTFARAVASAQRDGMSRISAAVGMAPLSSEERQIADLEGEARYRERIRCPTTVLVGELDVPFLPLADELAAGIAGAHLVRIAGAGHSPQKSGRAAWLAAVRAHVTRVRTIPARS